MILAEKYSRYFFIVFERGKILKKFFKLDEIQKILIAVLLGFSFGFMLNNDWYYALESGVIAILMIGIYYLGRNIE